MNIIWWHNVCLWVWLEDESEMDVCVSRLVFLSRLWMCHVAANFLDIEEYRLSLWAADSGGGGGRGAAEDTHCLLVPAGPFSGLFMLSSMTDNWGGVCCWYRESIGNAGDRDSSRQTEGIVSVKKQLVWQTMNGSCYISVIVLWSLLAAAAWKAGVLAYYAMDN